MRSGLAVVQSVDSKQSWNTASSALNAARVYVNSKREEKKKKKEKNLNEKH